MKEEWLKRLFSLSVILICLSCKNTPAENKESPMKIQELNQEFIIDTVSQTLIAECEIWKNKVDDFNMDVVWTLTEFVSDFQWNYCYGVSSCEKVLVRDSQEFDSVILNAGGWLRIIYRDNKVKYKGCITNECWGYFLLDRMCDEKGDFLE